MSITGKLNINVKRLKMIKTTTKQAKQILEDQRDELNLLNELKRINKWDIMRKTFPVSFKASTGIKLFGVEVFEYFYINGYDPFADEYSVSIRCGLTNRIKDEKWTEGRIIDLIDLRMVL